ncbi:acyltransferase family protein [Pedobacter nototheniae]|uniref:acyltransferase family protein n=1 Tax=Pedobacter nototheniae TaxID=2488994 RepID=UPI00103FA3EA|nr:acyltransferase [Pedobacter nototheniae]
MTKRSDILDFIRWVAAFMVVSGHIRSILFNDYSASIHNPIYKALYFVTGFGHQAVIVFFVLSGYLIGRSVVAQLKNGKFNLSNYLISRFSRIYIVLLPALILTWLVDKTGTFIDQKGIYTSCDYITSLQKDPAGRLTILHFLSSLTMLQNIWLPVLGSNGPLWSLSPEFWYYMIFPALAGIFFYRFNYKRFLISILIIFIFLYFSPLSVISYFLIWLCGLLAYFIKPQNLIIRYLSLAAFGITLCYSRIYDLNFTCELAIAVTLALALTTFDDHEKILKAKWFNQKMASFSYSLYLIHYPVGLFILIAIDRFITPIVKIEMNFYSLFLYLLTLIIIYFISYFFAKATEYKTSDLKKILIR